MKAWVLDNLMLRFLLASLFFPQLKHVRLFDEQLQDVVLGRFHTIAEFVEQINFKVSQFDASGESNPMSLVDASSIMIASQKLRWKNKTQCRISPKLS